MKVHVEKISEYDSSLNGSLYGLYTEDGELLYKHFCSDVSFAYDDLYLNRQDRIKELEERFGNVELIMC